jgi:hypothetical protein
MHNRDQLIGHEPISQPRLDQLPGTCQWQPAQVDLVYLALTNPLTQRTFEWMVRMDLRVTIGAQYQHAHAAQVAPQVQQ